MARYCKSCGSVSKAISPNRTLICMIGIPSQNRLSIAFPGTVFTPIIIYFVIQ